MQKGRLLLRRCSTMSPSSVGVPRGPTPTTGAGRAAPLARRLSPRCRTASSSPPAPGPTRRPAALGSGRGRGAMRQKVARTGFKAQNPVNFKDTPT